jgi:hypothetical protein
MKLTAYILHHVVEEIRGLLGLFRYLWAFVIAGRICIGWPGFV